MNRIAPWIFFPLACMALCFLLECLANGVDLHVDRTNNFVTIWTTNNTFRCAMFEWNSNLSTTNWEEYHGYFAGRYEPASKGVSMVVTANLNQTFWRLRDCANP